MKLGITLPLIDIGGDPATVRDFAQAAEGLGYDGLGAPDHVLGVNVASRPDWGQRNTSADLFHDPQIAARNMLVDLPLPYGKPGTLALPNSPIHLSETPTVVGRPSSPRRQTLTAS